MIRYNKEKKGFVMIQKICKMSFSDIDYINIKCNRCKGDFNYQSTDYRGSLLKGCPMCGNIWDEKEMMAIKELSNAYWVLKESNQMRNLSVGFVSVEDAS